MDTTEYHREVQRLRALKGRRERRSAGVGAKRLSQSQIIEWLLTAQRSREHSSVSLTRNAKGDTQIDVSVRTDEGGDVQTIDQAAAKARAIYDSLRAAYPMVSTPAGGSEISPPSAGKLPAGDAKASRSRGR